MAPERTIRVTARPLEAAAWGPFGWLPVRDTDPEDGSSRLVFEWSDVHVNVICHRSDEVQRAADGLVCEMMFRHLTHTQALLVLKSTAVIAVAPPTCLLGDTADAKQIEAFILEPHDALVLHQGAWHWGPFPIDGPQVDLFNVQGLRYAEDNDCKRLEDLGVDVEIAGWPVGKSVS